MQQVVSQNHLSRRERRYQNRQKIRKEREIIKTRDLDDYDKVFQYEHLYRSYLNSRRGVRWKASIQLYVANASLKVSNTYIDLANRQFVSPGFFEFDLCERGKQRHIRSVCMEERVVQRCVCDYSLVPMLKRTFIYDNGASMKGKGIHFATGRMTTHLQRYYREHGSDGYILTYDFSKYFDNISHETLFKIIDKCYKDEDLKKLIKSFIEAFGTIGLGLGSQVSQILSLAAASAIDHYMKEVMRCKYYGRYMDDGYIISHSKEFLEKCMTELKRLCDELGIILNTKKTRIVPLKRGFQFLKIKFYLQDSGRILKKICRDSVTRMRRKLKKFKKKLDEGKILMQDVYQSMQSWLSHSMNTNSYKTRHSMLTLYHKLFGKYIFSIGGMKYALQGIE